MKQIIIFSALCSNFFSFSISAQNFPDKLSGTYCESNEYVGFCITFAEDSFHKVVGSMTFSSSGKGIYRIKENQLIMYHSRDTTDEGNIIRYEIIKATEDEIVYRKDGNKSTLKKSKQ